METHAILKSFEKERRGKALQMAATCIFERMRKLRMVNRRFNCLA
jgi:hypothetical protein